MEKNRQKIEGADYSLYIKVEGDDPKKPFLNRKVLANFVTMQIKGLYKKFKNMIKADDVVYIHGEGLQSGRSYENRLAMTKLPNPAFIIRIAGDGTEKDWSITLAKFVEINKAFNKAIADKKIKDNEDAQNFIKKWEKLRGLHGVERCTEITADEWKKFLNDYVKDWDAFEKKYNLDESEPDESAYVACDLIDDLFEDGGNADLVSAVYEEDNDKGRGGEGVDANLDVSKPGIKEKFIGPVKQRIADIRQSDVESGNVKFDHRMHMTERVDVGFCKDFGSSVVAEYGMKGEFTETAASGKYKYYIFAYFKKPREFTKEFLKQHPPRQKSKKGATNESSILDEIEEIIEGENLVVKYIKDHKLTREQALSDEHVEQARGYERKKRISAEKVRAAINKYFDSPGGKEWKGTPGYEHLNTENVLEAFKLAA